MHYITQFINGKACIQPQTQLVSKPTHCTSLCGAHKLIHVQLENEDPDMLDTFCWMFPPPVTHN